VREIEKDSTEEDALAVVTMKNLLESGVHFGHQTKRWDPRMKKYIFAERNGIHIIDLQKTIAAIKQAYDVVRQTVLDGRSILMVGTKKQAQQTVEREAKRAGIFFVNNRWLGGMLTNFTTIKKSILRLNKIEKMEVDGTFESLTKKEISRLLKEKASLERNLGGIKEMKDLPGIVFIIDTRKEAIAVAEAKKMKIPIVAIVDTNCNPDGISYPIPGNDDAIRAITLFTQIIANAVIEAENEVGLEVIETLQEEDEGEALSQTGAKEEAAPEENLETVPVGAAVGELEEGADEPGFTTEDYSEYNPDEAEKKEPIEAETADNEVLLEQNVEDEDKLYEE
jgi:small subunit ribosomal protein S2